MAAAKARDVGEADTLTTIKDMVEDVIEYDKYLEVTSEFSIRGTYCDSWYRDRRNSANAK